MATTIDAVLVGVIAVLLIGFLVLIVVYGGNVTNEVNILTEQFQTALLTAETQFGQVVVNATTIFSGLADVAGQAFAGLVPKIISTFTLIGNYFSDQLRAVIKQVTNNLFGSSGAIANNIVSGIQTAASAFVTTVEQIQNFFTGVYNQILGLISQAVMFVTTFVNAIINQVVNGIATGIIFVIRGIEIIVADIGQLIATGLAQIPVLLTDVETTFDGLVSVASTDILSIVNALTAFGEEIVSVFQAVPHFTTCVLRCICHFVPLITCPTSCCCSCCPDANCGNCGGTSCCPCEDSCFFPSNCCTSGCGTVCSLC